MSDERKPMTDEELDAIKGRLAAITEWPWIAFCRTGVRHRMGITNKRLFDDGDSPEVLDVVELGDNAGGIKSEADAAFIANAPDDIARLLAEVERLREENKRLCGELERLHEEADWLADWLEIESPYCYECEFKDERYSEYEENITWCAHAPDGTNDTCDQSWRKAARKAIEEERNAE